MPGSTKLHRNYSPLRWITTPTLFFFLLLIRTTNGCYTSSFNLESCGAVGQPTRVTNIFPKNTSARGLVRWGDEEITRGFVAENSTADGITVLENQDDNVLIMEHVYDQAGTYSVYFKITVFRNETIAESNICIEVETPTNELGEAELIIEVSENGCKANFSAAMSNYSFWIGIISTAIGTALLLY